MTLTVDPASTEPQNTRGWRRVRVLVGLFVLSYVTTLVITVYFAVKKSTSGPSSPKKEYTLEELQSLELEIANRFRLYHCNDGKKNSFKVYDSSNQTRYCYYIFTDHKPQWYIENGCKFFWGNYLTAYADSVFGLLKVYVDFKICCLNYFRERDSTWWNSLPLDDRRVAFTRPGLSYELNVYTNCGIRPSQVEFASLQTKCNCSWGEFDPYWKSLKCTYRPSYSHVCLYKEFATEDINKEPWLDTDTHSGGPFG